jgi:hypothetical protein
MIRDLLYALAVAVMMRLACVGMAESPRVSVTVLCWSVPLVLGVVAFASLRIVRRMQQHEDGMPQRGARWEWWEEDDA